MSPEALAQVLRPLQDYFRAEDHPQLLVGLAVSDDAAVYKISDEVAVVQTLDFFPPIVDDPYDFGSIAAANAMSDIYAMGGEVVLALNICGFPADLPVEIITEILRGGAEKVTEAGAVIAGGHTIKDDEPKYGLSVMGLIHPQRILTKAGARPGDMLLLTKPLGVGVITTAAKFDKADLAHVAVATESMKKLNREASHLVQKAGIHACTDVTGFALLGHGCEMAEKSGVGLHIQLSRLPFVDGAKKYAKDWLFPVGTCDNDQCYQQQVRFEPGIPEEIQQLLYTPETSGGLLVSVPQDKAAWLLDLFDEADQPCWEIGEIMEGEGTVVVSP